MEQSTLLRLSLKLNSLKGFCSFLSGNMKYIEMYTHWQHSLPFFFFVINFFENTRGYLQLFQWLDICHNDTISKMLTIIAASAH